MKLASRTIPVVLILVFGAVLSAHAQTNLSADFGLGTATDGSTGTCAAILPELGYSEPPGPCTGVYAGEYPTTAMGGVFGVFGADFMFSHYLGVGGEYAFRFAQAPYADINYRPNFYDFNLIYHPVTTHRVVPEIQGGVGGVNLRFYTPSSSSIIGTTPGEFIQSANHFQIHAGAAVKIYVKGGIFVKPQFDIHYAPGLNQQFSSDWVPEYTVAVGYTFGER